MARSSATSNPHHLHQVFATPPLQTYLVMLRCGRIVQYLQYSETPVLPEEYAVLQPDGGFRWVRECDVAVGVPILPTAYPVVSVSGRIYIRNHGYYPAPPSLSPYIVHGSLVSRVEGNPNTVMTSYPLRAFTAPILTSGSHSLPSGPHTVYTPRASPVRVSHAIEDTSSSCGMPGPNVQAGSFPLTGRARLLPQAEGSGTSTGSSGFNFAIPRTPSPFIFDVSNGLETPAASSSSTMAGRARLLPQAEGSGTSTVSSGFDFAIPRTLSPFIFDVSNGLETPAASSSSTSWSDALNKLFSIHQRPP